MHLGRNVGKIRELLGVKQESLAAMLKISQQTISKIEQNEHLSQASIDRIAQALGVSAAAITQYDEKLIINYLKGSETFLASDVRFEYLRLFEKILMLFDRLVELGDEKEQVIQPFPSQPPNL
jgi:transcriptional regulator with XRE-family HTH domain